MYDDLFLDLRQGLGGVQVLQRFQYVPRDVLQLLLAQNSFRIGDAPKIAMTSFHEETS